MKFETLATITVQAYGQSHTIVVTGNDHRPSGAINIEEAIGSQLMNALDVMKSKAGREQ